MIVGRLRLASFLSLQDCYAAVDDQVINEKRMVENTSKKDWTLPTLKTTIFSSWNSDQDALNDHKQIPYENQTFGQLCS